MCTTNQYHNQNQVTLDPPVTLDRRNNAVGGGLERAPLSPSLLRRLQAEPTGQACPRRSGLDSIAQWPQEVRVALTTASATLRNS